MKLNTLKVRALWDDDAKVWVAESDEVPGLVAEATTIEGLLEKLRVRVPELLELNRAAPDVREVLVEVIGEYRHQEKIGLPAA
jgi:hypothetical protein